MTIGQEIELLFVQIRVLDIFSTTSCFSATRAQKSIALSNAASESLTVSAATPGLYLRKMLETVLGTADFLELRVASSATPAMLKRQGDQNTRHISTGLLLSKCFWSVQNKIVSTFAQLACNLF